MHLNNTRKYVIHIMIALVISVSLFSIFGCSITGQSTLHSDFDQEESIRIKTLKLNNIEQICHKDNRLSFIIENTGTKTIDTIIATIYAKHTYNIKIFTSILPGEAKEQTINFGSQNTVQPSKITIIPESEQKQGQSITLNPTKCEL